MQKTVTVADLTGKDLDRWVAHVIGAFLTSNLRIHYGSALSFSQQWEAAGYLMEKFNIGLTPPSATQPLWTAWEAVSGTIQRCDDAKTAAMRCLVASRMGDVFTTEENNRFVPLREFYSQQNMDALPPRAKTQPATTAASSPAGNLPALSTEMPDSWI